MEDADVLTRLGLALAIGLLLGLERGWHDRDADDGARIAGIRTFALTGLLGGVCGWLAVSGGSMLPALAFLAVAGLLAASYVMRVRTDDDFGLTTEIALLLTYALGLAAALGAAAPAAAVAVVATLLLSMKTALHAWIDRIEKLELDALLKLGLLSVVVLPQLPNRGFGPGEVLNPYALWWAVVLVAGLSFAGYVAMRLAGARLGVLAIGVFGGLASSTSATIALARLVRANGALAAPATVGVVLASAMTFLRVLAIAAVLQPALAAALVATMGAMAAAGLVCAAVAHAFAGGEPIGKEEIRGIANPLELRPALGFGAALAAVLVGVHYLRETLGAQGVYVGAALAGVAGVDAPTISVAQEVGGGVSPADGAVAVLLAAAVTTAVKAILALALGGWRLGLRVAPACVAMIAAGAAALLLGPGFSG